MDRSEKKFAVRMELVRILREGEERQGTAVHCMCHNASRQELYTGHEDAVIRVWDLQKYKMSRALLGHSGWVTCLLHRNDSRVLISGSLDMRLIFWDWKGNVLLLWDAGEPVQCMSWCEITGLLVGESSVGHRSWLFAMCDTERGRTVGPRAQSGRGPS